MEKENKILPQFDLMLVLRQWWNRKWNILAIAFIAAVIGYLLSLSMPRKYRTEVVLAPESSESDLASAASSITSMLGIGAGPSGSDAIYPELYPDIVSSVPFCVEILNMQVCTSDSSYVGDLYHYLTSHQKQAWWTKSFNVIKKIFKNPAKMGAYAELDAYKLNRRQMALIKSYCKKVTCSVDIKTSVITISSVMQDPLVACMVADNICKKLQTYVVDYRTNKARGDLASMTVMFEEAKADYVEAQIAYAQYVDCNTNIVRESARTEMVRLENEMNLTYNVYNELATQLAMAKAKVLEKTPVFTILAPARIPEWHFAPTRRLVALLFAIMGGIVACCIVTLKENKTAIRRLFFKNDGHETD